ncbi:MAG: hypothetical protein JXA20_11290 [Spirochaetes bacterium]|nr:hypothetical protein [Spirochaetota bacterium]
MKRTLLLLAVLLAAYCMDGRLIADDRPKIYIRALIPSKETPIPQSHSNLISQFFENTMINMIKDKYDVMSHSTAKAMMTEKAELDALSCNDESCMQTIIKAIQAEYLVFGEIQSMGKMNYIISVKLMHRRPGGLAVIQGSSLQQVEKIEFNDVKKAAERSVNELLGNIPTSIAQNDTPTTPQNQDSGSTAPPVDENSQKASAAWVSGSSINGSFSSAMRVNQWYRLPAQKARNKTFTLTHDRGNDFDFAIYDDNRLIATASGTAPSESINTTAVSGTCFVKVWNYRGAGNYTINMTNYVDPKLSAQRVNGMTVSGSFPSSQRTEQWFRLGGQEGSSPTFTMQHNASVDFDFSVYRDDALVSTGQGTAPTDSVTCRFQGGGTTFLKVWNFRGSGPYSISINRESVMGGSLALSHDHGSPAGNMDKASAQMVRGMTIQGSFPSSMRTEQWFRLAGQEGVNPTFSIQHDSSADFDFAVYSNDSVACTAQGTTSGDTVTCHVPGTCYIKVWNFRGSGSYTIQVRR